MKKYVSLIVVGLLAFALVACGGDNKDTANDTQTKTEAKTEAKNVMQDSGTVGNFTVAIKSAKLSKSYEGDDAVTVTYDFTNNGDEAQSFDVVIDDTVYQNGVELEFAVISGSTESNSMKKIQKGASLEVEKSYKLQDKTSPINVEVKELFTFSDQKITKTLELQ